MQDANPDNGEGVPATSTGAQGVAPARSAAFIFIFITVLLDMLALGIIIPVLPKLVVDFLAGDAASAADYLSAAGLVWRITL